MTAPTHPHGPGADLDAAARLRAAAERHQRLAVALCRKIHLSRWVGRCACPDCAPTDYCRECDLAAQVAIEHLDSEGSK